MMITRIVFVVALALGFFAAPLLGEAQPDGRVIRIGMIAVGPPETAIAVAPFRRRLLELGYAEGPNLVLEARYARGREEILPELASGLVRLGVDVIYAPGDPVVLAAKRATSTIPVVMVACDAVAAGLIQSLSRPGGNVTGITCLSSDLSAKRLELLRQVAPKMSRLAVVWNASDPGKAVEWRNTQVAAQAFGMTPTSLEVRSASDIDTVLTATTRQRFDAMLVLGDGLTINHRRKISELSARNGIPVAYGYREFVEAGGLISYGPALPEMYRRAAEYVDGILRGAKPADLPVEQPTKFELLINLKTAKTLRLTIPQSLLLRADQVIE